MRESHSQREGNIQTDKEREIEEGSRESDGEKDREGESERDTNIGRERSRKRGVWDRESEVENAVYIQKVVTRLLTRNILFL